MRLYNAQAQRLYINAGERAQFLLFADKSALQIRSLCYTLTYTGCRISEALNLMPQSIQMDAQVIAFRTLKRRSTMVIREVPVPDVLLQVLCQAHDLAAQEQSAPLWQHDGQRLCRTTAYRWIKSVMHDAEIVGAQASPKGLRHGYGIHAIRCGVQLNMLQKWMGHASMDTTAIYANAIGAEELAIADRMWE